MSTFPENKSEIEVVESRTIKRVTIKNFISNVFDAFNVTRGGIYTLKTLLLNPGQLVADYLGRDRYKIIAPFRILILSTTIILFFFYSSDFYSGMMDGLKIGSNGETKDLVSAVVDELSKYFNLLLWVFIPILSLLSYLFNRKRDVNFAENLVFQTYILSLSNIILIILSPLLLVSTAFATVLYQLVSFFFIVYSYKIFFKKSWLRSFLENLVIYSIGSLFWLITVVLIVAVMTILMRP